MTGRGPVQVTVYVETDNVGSAIEDVVEVDRDEWDAMSPAERVDHLQGLAVEHRNEFSDYGWRVDDPADDPRGDGRVRGQRPPKART